MEVWEALWAAVAVWYADMYAEVVSAKSVAELVGPIVAHAVVDAQFAVHGPGRVGASDEGQADSPAAAVAAGMREADSEHGELGAAPDAGVCCTLVVAIGAVTVLSA